MIIICANWYRQFEWIFHLSIFLENHGQKIKNNNLLWKILFMRGETLCLAVGEVLTILNDPPYESFNKSFYDGILHHPQLNTIRDTDWEKEIAPLIANYIKKFSSDSDSPNRTRKQHKAEIVSQILQWMEANTKKLMAEPKRIIHTDDRRLRRFDALSQVLSIDNKYSACIAVAQVAGIVVISSNALQRTTEVRYAAALRFKLSRLDEFIKAAKPLIINKDKAGLKIIAITTASSITSESEGLGSAADYDRRSSAKKLKVHELVARQLQKIVYSIYDQQGQLKKTVFTEADLEALLNLDRAIYLLPNPDYVAQFKGFVHAEQLIRDYILDHGSVIKHPIGISKLCCWVCDVSLSQSSQHVLHRGTHGIQFINTIDTITTKVVEEMSATGPQLNELSSSEPDDDSDDEDDSLLSVPPHQSRVQVVMVRPSNHSWELVLREARNIVSRQHLSQVGLSAKFECSAKVHPDAQFTERDLSHLLA